MTTILKRKLPRDIKDAQVATAHRIANVAVKIAKKECPVDTGSLKKSVRKDSYARPKGNFLYIGIRAGGYITNPKTGRKVDYARQVHDGTRFQRPQPFLRFGMRQAMRKESKFFWEELTSIGV